MHVCFDILNIIKLYLFSFLIFIIVIYIDYENKPLVFQCPTLLNDNLPIKITDDYYELEIPLITQEKNKQNNSGKLNSIK